jgi:FkbH-like protein
MMDSLKYSEILQLNKDLKATITGKPFKVAILSNVIVSTIKEPLEYLLRKNGLNPEIEIGNFDNIVQDSAVQDSSDLVIVFYELLNIADGISGYVEAVGDQRLRGLEEKLLNETDLILQNLSKTPKVVFNLFSSMAFETGYTGRGNLTVLEERLNQHLRSKTEKNLVLLNTDRVVAEVGIREAYDYRFYASSKAPYTLSFYKRYLVALEPEIRKMSGESKKALLLDCDNTLWKGVVGEDGLDGIDLSSSSISGKPFHDVQHIIKYLASNGVILVLTSKNNLKDVEDVFFKHPDMVLKPEDIVIWKVNWTDKATNIKEVANELNIGLDSLIFVDDSDFEINLVKDQLPEVEVFQVPKSSYLYKNEFIRMYRAHFNLAVSEEDRNKTRQYKEQFQRESVKQQFGTTEDYIRSLGIRVILTSNDLKNVIRLAQLTQKTNQFNLTTHRYSELQMEGFITNPAYHVFSGAVSDTYGDSGITLLAVVAPEESSSKLVRIDTFLMSCRIIGRNIEHAVLGEILRFLKEKGYESVHSEYIPTPKNDQVRLFYEQNGFRLIGEAHGTKQYRLDLSEHDPAWPDFLTLETQYTL